VGTERYYAPEVAKPPMPAGRQSDMFSLGCVFLEVITVLAGRELQELYDYLSKDFHYHEELHKLQPWLDNLKNVHTSSKCPLDINAALAWISPLLKKERKDRPYALQLVNTIAEDTDKLNCRSQVFCDVCQTELRVNTNITHDQTHEYDRISIQSNQTSKEALFLGYLLILKRLANADLVIRDFIWRF
jgi:serine/threonine protein kinase